MTIEQAIEQMEENGLPKAIAGMAKFDSEFNKYKGYLDMYFNMKQFTRPALMRTSFEPSTNEDIEIMITTDYNEMNDPIDHTTGEVYTEEKWLAKLAQLKKMRA